MYLSQPLPGLYVGSCPESVDDLSQLKTDYGVTAILSLQTDRDLDYGDLDWRRVHSRCKELGVVAKRIPIKGDDAADLREKLPQCVDAAAELLQAGHTVFAHCNAGMDRSASVAVGLLHWKKGWSLDKAINTVGRCHFCGSEIERFTQRGAGI